MTPASSSSSSLLVTVATYAPSRRRPKVPFRSESAPPTHRTSPASGSERAGPQHIPVEKSYTLAEATFAHTDSRAGHTRGRRVIVV